MATGLYLLPCCNRSRCWFDVFRQLMQLSDGQPLRVRVQLRQGQLPMMCAVDGQSRGRRWQVGFHRKGWSRRSWHGGRWDSCVPCANSQPTCKNNLKLKVYLTLNWHSFFNAVKMYYCAVIFKYFYSCRNCLAVLLFKHFLNAVDMCQRVDI